RALGYQQNRISREELAAFEGTTMDLGDILTYRIPGIRIKRDNVLMGLPYCIEFRGASGGSILRGRGTTDPGCNSPEVYLDGVLVSNPSSLYPSIPVETVESIEVIPPSEAGSRFGTGALWGAIVIESRRPGRPWSSNSQEEAPAAAARRFDWDLEPGNHPGGRVFLSALAANAAGVALGLALSNECIRFRNPGFDSIVSDCSGEGTMLAAAAGVAIPAVSAAAAARWAGDTDLSRGRFMAATIGAAVALIPGYAFLISSRRDGSGAVEAMGSVMLLIGAPFAVSVADRLFRSFR
ncbi:MAG: TonB-dependent receptor plug domain-containing protein, partial [Gemmatimonadetes bacterium]|nr:TonB-dependent receptor plug domain-containing protein [Gemmatimonadota bacterium]